ncbi:MAG: Na(+) H(+) antiporter subunit D [Firmicutes bacterium]|nr:Na(+) H(+) antiporter subunit D [Bacillota bacterium]
METVRNFPVLIIYIFFIGSFIQPLVRNVRISLLLTVAISAVSSAASAAVVYYVRTNGDFLFDVAPWSAPWGIELSIGTLEAFVIAVICSVGTLISIYGIGMVEKEIPARNIKIYNALFLALLGSMTGIAATGDIFNMYVFIEITSITACGIISVKDDKKSIEATVKYLVYSSLASGCILLAIALLYGITGNLNIRYIHHHLTEVMYLYPRNVLLASCLIIVGFGLKAAMFPLHFWLPDAHSSAPTTSSAVLSALVLKAYSVGLIKILTGVFGIVVMSLLPLKTILMYLGSGAVLIGSLLAMTQSRIKRMLAYSSVVQMGYIFLALSLFNRTGFTGALFQILNHALTKTLLFLSAGNIKYYTGKESIEQLKGIGYRMPVTMAVFSVGALSMVGLPMTSGFNSKWYIGYGAIEAGKIGVLIVIVISSLLNAAYYLPVVVSAFFRRPSPGDEIQQPVNLPWFTSVPMIVMAVLIIVLGLYPDPVINFISGAAKIF